MSFNDAGYQYYRQSRFNVAQGKFDRGPEATTASSTAGWASPPTSTTWGSSPRTRDDPKQAVVYFQEALEINRELHDPSGLSETLNNLGLV